MSNAFKDFKNRLKELKDSLKNMKNPFPHLNGRHLYRSPKDAVVFGICAGLADYLQVDPVFVRLGAVVIAFFSSVWPAVLAYTVAAFLVPIDPAQDTVAARQEPKDVTSTEPVEKAEEKAEPVEKMDSDQNM